MLSSIYMAYKNKSRYRKIKKLVYEQYGSICFYCGDDINDPYQPVDHIEAQILGGKDVFENLVPCCQSCNSRKLDKTLNQWIEYNKEAIKESEEVIRRCKRTLKAIDSLS